MNRALFGLVILVVLAGLGAGLAVVGGPGYARQENADRERLKDLRRFAEFKTCELTPSSQTKDCDGLLGSANPVDPATGKRFTFEKDGEDAFKVCAVFQTDPQSLVGYDAKAMSIDGQLGCYTYRRNADNGRWLRG